MMHYDDEQYLKIAQRERPDVGRIIESKKAICHRCPYYNHAFVSGYGNLNAKVILVGDSPWKTEQRTGIPFSGPAGEMLNIVLEEVEVNRDDVFVTNSIHCLPSNLGEVYPPEAIKLCAEHFLKEELEKIHPEVVVVMGNNALKAFVPKERGNITKVRGLARDVEFFDKSYRTIPTFHPSYLLRNPTHAQYVANDMRLAFGMTKKIQGDVKYRQVNTRERLQYFYKVAEEAKIYAFDIETTSLDYRTAEVISLNFSFKEREAYVVTFFHEAQPKAKGDPPENKATCNLTFAKWLYKYLHNPNRRVFGHNLKFDFRVMDRWFQDMGGPGIQIDKIRWYDTMGMAGLIDENMRQRLKEVVPFYTDIRYTREELDDIKSGKAKKMPHKKLVNYGCLHGDSKVLLADGKYESISQLVSRRFNGKIYCYDGNEITTGRVVGWHKNINVGQEWYKIITPTTEYGRWGALGGSYTPDHEIYTQRGKVSVEDLCIGEDRILTNEYCFSTDQLSVFLGSLLGDGGIDDRNGVKCGFRFGQSRARLPYADWKADVFYNFYPKFRDLQKYRDMKTNRFPGGMYTLPYSRYLSYLCDSFPRHNVRVHAYKKLILTSKVLKFLGPLGLAVWYQDDGSLGSSHTRLVCTKFLESEVSIFKYWMLHSFGIRCEYYPSNGVFLFSGEDEVKFHNTIAPYMHPCCVYKSLFPEKINHPYLVVASNRLFYERIIDVKRYYPKPSSRGNNTRYCLTVEKHGNFVTLDGVVSNCKDADGTLRIGNQFVKELHKKGLWDGPFLNRDYSDMSVAPMLFKMELFGAPIKKLKMMEIRHLIESKIVHFHKQMEREARKKFNPRSTPQLSEVMYKTMGFVNDSILTSSMKPSTDKNAIKMLIDENPQDPFLTALKYFREYDTVNKTFVKGLEERLAKDGRLHPDFSWTNVVSGRVVCRNPNLANIPRDSEFEEGVLLSVREMFAARPGWRIISADYSQIEYKVAALRSGDSKMIEDIFLHHQDFHDMIARSAYPQYEKAEAFLKRVMHQSMTEELEQRIASVKIKLKDWRTDAKRFNFASLFGAENETLARNLGVDEDRVEEIIANVESRYPEFWQWVKEVGPAAVEVGWLKSAFGRIRRLPSTPDQREMSRQERKGMNFKPQSEAAYVGRGALVRIGRRCEKEGLQGFPFNVVYDCILLECPEDEVETCKTIMAEEMLRPVPELDNHIFSVELGEGESWKEAERNGVKIFTIDDLEKVLV